MVVVGVYAISNGMDIINRISGSKFLYFSLAAAVLLTVSFFINFNGSFVITDPDGYYHMRHARLYGTDGIFDTSFPWTQYSVTRTLKGDLWYGFHILLIPFTLFSDLIWGIKMAGVAITFGALFLYFFAVYRLKLRFSLLWAAVFPLFYPLLLERFAVTRPHPLSVGLNILLFSFLVRGGIWPVFIISFLLSFIHLNLFWVPILMLIVISMARLINKQSLDVIKATALLSGLAAGAFLRPHPLATLELNYIQLVDLTVQKMKGLNLAFGFELYPLGLVGLSLYALIVFTILVLLFVWLGKKHTARITVSEKITMLTLMVLTTFYLVLTLFVVRRAIDFFIGYLFLFAAIDLTLYFNYELDNLRDDVRKLTGIVTVTLIISLAGYNAVSLLNSYGKYLSLEANPYRQEVPAKWLEKNSRQGEVVFHLGWARFPELFFWNQHNYYISAMDPIFLFAYDQSLYWESHFLSSGEGGEYTCSYRRCTKDEAIKTDLVLREHFKASYVYITALNNGYPGLYFYMLESPKKYKEVFSDGGVAIFKVIY